MRLSSALLLLGLAGLLVTLAPASSAAETQCVNVETANWGGSTGVYPYADDAVGVVVVTPTFTAGVIIVPGLCQVAPPCPREQLQACG